MALSAQALTTLAEVKTELMISGSSEDSYLERLIESASARIAGYCNRAFYWEADIAEAVAGYGHNNLIVLRAPIVSISSITYSDSAVDADNYSVGDAEGGLIYRKDGWSWTASYRVSASPEKFPGSENKSYEVIYSGGYVTQNQVDLDGSLTRTLPYDLEDACIEFVTSRYSARGRDRNLTSEKIGAASETYAQSSSSDVSGTGKGIPDSIKGTLNVYRRAILA